MLRDFREQLGLTRQELALETGRSVNFILKAEQLTFPTAPPALTDYYAKALNISPITQREAYRDAQRQTRLRFHHYFIPRPLPTAGFTFCRKWYLVDSNYHNSPDSPDYPDLVSPSQYLVSKVLCVPASAVYYAERHPHKPVAQAITDALSDLLTACRAGILYSEFPNYADAQVIHDGVERIYKEVLHGRPQFNQPPAGRISA